MSLVHAVLILICVLALAVGQLLFKYSAIVLEKTEGTPSLFHLAGNPWFLTSLVIYGGATLLWVWVLRQVPLTVAYPFFALSFVIVPFLSGIFLGEQVDASYWFGISLIIIGIVITTL